MRGSTGGGFRPTMQRLLLIGFGVALALGLLEIGLRAVGTVPEVENPLYSFHQSEPTLGWIGVPEIRQRFVREDFDALIEHTAAGFRRPDPPVPEGAPKNVLVLGDSFVWGWGVGQGEVFTDGLQRRLGSGVAVHNRGVNGFGTSQQLLLLRLELDRRQYDEVLLLFIDNDFADNLSSKKGRRPYFELDGDRLVPQNQPPRRLMSPIAYFVKRSLAIAWIDHRISTLVARMTRAISPPGRDEDHEETESRPTPEQVATTAALLREMRRLCEAYGAGLTVVVAQERPARETLLEICGEEGLACVDLLPTLSARDDSGDLYLQNDGHWSVAGHRAVAEALVAEGPALIRR